MDGPEGGYSADVKWDASGVLDGEGMPKLPVPKR